MITLPLTELDWQYLKFLHAQFYSGDFDFPRFNDKTWLAQFKILSDEGKIVTAGGVKLNPELILITDKEADQRNRAFALISALQIATLLSKAAGHDLVSTTVIDDEKWLEQLKSFGFRDSRGNHLVIG